MAKKSGPKRIPVVDFSKWNFVIFLTLSLMLIVGITYAMNFNLFQLRARAARQKNPCNSPVLPADWNQRKIRCVESQGGDFSFEIDQDNCTVIPICTVRGLRMNE